MNFQKLLDNRKFFAIFWTALGIILSILIGFLLSLVRGDLSRVWILAKWSYILFFANTIPTSALLLVTQIPEDLTFGFGCGLYYGTLATATLLQKILAISENTALEIGFIIDALICYIVWLKIFKKDL